LYGERAAPRVGASCSPGLVAGFQRPLGEPRLAEEDAPKPAVERSVIGEARDPPDEVVRHDRPGHDVTIADASVKTSAPVVTRTPAS
jgi:hypothetical protein